MSQSPEAYRARLPALLIATLLIAGLAIVAVGNGWLPAAQSELVRAYGWPSLSLVLVALVAASLRMRSLSADAIARQLQVWRDSSTEEFGGLRNIAPNSAVGIAWNELVQRIKRLEEFEKIAGRIESQFQASTANAHDAVLDALTDGIVVTDTAGNITFLNKSAGMHLNCEKPGEAIGKSLLMLLAELNDCALDELLTKLNDSGGIGFGDEGESEYRCSKRMLIDEIGARQGAIWTIRDVTQQQLADRTRDQFVATATHELRTPLANIQAYAESLIINEDIDVESQKEFCNIIRTEASRLARFVDELLDLNRIQAGSLMLDLGKTDLQRVLDEICEKVRPQMAAKQIELECSLPVKLPEVMVDKEKLVSALVNILGNAAKYTPEGRHVWFNVEHDDGKLKFQVKDSGIGISAEDLPKIFDQFYRAEDERVRDITGSGLGLAFSLEVARLHGGDIEVQSELNQGSEFSLVIPAVEVRNHVSV